MFNFLKNKFKIFDEQDKDNLNTQNNYEIESIQDEMEDEIEDEIEVKNNKIYTFLDKQDNPLSITFGNFNDIDKVYTIHICIYNINNECKLPFLQFLINSEESLSFPRIENFKCDLIEDDAEPNTLFMNKCITEVLDKLGVHESFSAELLEKMYKGFIEQDDNNIFVVFESLPEFNYVPTSNSQWCILAEIMNGCISDKHIDHIIKSFFLKNTFMTEIYNVLDKNIVPTPLVLNICVIDNNSLVISKNPSFIDLTAKHEWLGDYFYFKKSCESDTDRNSIKYAVFIDDKAKYILQDISIINDIQKKDFLTSSSNEIFNSLYFHQDGVQYWYVKSNKQFTRI
jgi:hypothetical protein